jgi:hypothetical protein
LELGPEPVALRVSVSGFGRREVELSFDFAEPREALPNDACAEATRLEADEPIDVDLRLAHADMATACAVSRAPSGVQILAAGSPWVDAIYELVLDEPSDVTAFAFSADPLVRPVLSLFAGKCDAPRELACAPSDVDELFARALPAGRYFLSVSAAVGAQIQLGVSLATPTIAADGESCEQALDLPSWVPTVLDPKPFADDVRLECSNSGRDAVFSVSLSAASDVLLRARPSLGDRVALGLATSAGGCVSELLTCGASSEGEARIVVHDLPAGSYHAVFESERANPLEALFVQRPSRAPMVVAQANNCDTALLVPSAGGFFTGNTQRADHDVTASCDLPGASLDGTASQWLKLSFSERTHLVLDSAGSAIPTLLDLRQGESCPGQELPSACTVGADSSAGAYFERVLEPGDYWLQVMGFAGSAGRWNLEIFSDTSK